jgi:4-amino-4-deoxy-L-arabinose transferase-like glycosyltransferase
MPRAYNKLNAWVVLAALMAFMLAASLFTVFRYGDYFNLKSDDARYVQSAVTLLNKGMLTYHDQNTPSVYIMPGHPALLAVFIKAAGMDEQNGVMAFRAFQAVLQTFSLLLIFLIGRELFNSTIALLACVMDAVYLPEIVSSGLILTEVEFKFLLLLLS